MVFLNRYFLYYINFLMYSLTLTKLNMLEEYINALLLLMYNNITLYYKSITRAHICINIVYYN